MAETDSTIELATDAGTDTKDNHDKLDLRRSPRKQQVMNPKGVASPKSHLDTRSLSKTGHDIEEDPEKLNSGESGHDVDRNLDQLKSGQIVLSIDEVELKN